MKKIILIASFLVLSCSSTNRIIPYPQSKFYSEGYRYIEQPFEGCESGDEIRFKNGQIFKCKETIPALPEKVVLFRADINPEGIEIKRDGYPEWLELRRYEPFGLELSVDIRYEGIELSVITWGAFCELLMGESSPVGPVLSELVKSYTPPFKFFSHLYSKTSYRILISGTEESYAISQIPDNTTGICKWKDAEGRLFTYKFM